MKSIFKLLLAITGILFIQACEKDLDIDNHIDAYSYATLDEDAGTWKTIHLSSATEIAIAAPESVTSPAYLAELAEVKTASASLTKEQKEIVEYWGANSLVRWNEIARNLVAKYNLPPAANPDGTYPAPSAQSPGTYPFFPFANPPYASRAYAYWSAAQFDALVSAWHYKYAFNRPAPYTVDAGIQAHLPKNSLPAYPSEDAVIAAVSQAILTAMFPLEADFIKAKADEHAQSRIWAGMNTGSDLAAGKMLGAAVAAKLLDRSKTDGMKNAVGNQAIWDSLANAAQATYGWHWVSLESPKRPPMLPLFGQVKPWCIPDVSVVRPGPPPAPGTPEFNTDLAEVEKYMDNPTEETRRIANYWADGAGTYTPPGHWNRIASELITSAQMNPIRTARTFAYLNMAVMDAGISCWDTKYFYHYPRPSQVSPGLRALLGVPNFPSYTSGHSTFSSAAATVLGHIFPEHAAHLEAMAVEASLSRIYGGIHFRFDCETGVEVGKAIANYSVVVAKADGAE